MSRFEKTRKFVVGTRGSKLARAQTQWVISKLQEANPGLHVDMEIIRTKGDRLQGKPLPEIGGKGLFTEELERALVEERIDLAVHSAKDLPTDLHDQLALLATPVREDPSDAWISADGQPFSELPEGGIVGTTSLRRQAQLLRRRPDLEFVGLRGNVDTRIGKVKRGDCAGAVLAMAGLTRASLASEATHVFDMDLCLPAPGQGALALEGRADDDDVAAVLSKIHDPKTHACLMCERTILHRLDAGCRAPLAALATIEDDVLHARARVLSPDGKTCMESEARGDAASPEQPAEKMVHELIQQGARELIAACRHERSD